LYVFFAAIVARSRPVANAVCNVSAEFIGGLSKISPRNGGLRNLPSQPRRLVCMLMDLEQGMDAIPRELSRHRQHEAFVGAKE
jgi:hypothetical protein